MSQYTFDSVSLMRVHTEDRKGAGKPIQLEDCSRTTLFDATICDSPAASHSILVPLTSSPLSRKLSLDSVDVEVQATEEKVSSRESSMLVDHLKETRSTASTRNATASSSKDAPKTGQPHSGLADFLHRFGLHSSSRK